LAQIYDRGANWELSIYPEITEAVEIIDEPEKGYRATLGFDPTTQRHVVSTVVYSKDMYGIQDVLAKVEALRTCERCDTLDKDRLTLESINIPTKMPTPIEVPPLTPQGPEHLPPTMVHNQIAAEPHQLQPAPSNVPVSQRVGPNVKDMFGAMILDTYLTDPGKYFLGLMLDDPTLSESAYPADPSKIPQFMGDMIDFMSGKVDFMRSPEEAREFLSVMQTQEDAKRVPGRPNVKKRLPGATDTFVIF
jgi:hypothetical protein